MKKFKLPIIISTVVGIAILCSVAYLVYSNQSDQKNANNASQDGKQYGQSPGEDSEGIALKPNQPEAQASKKACDLLDEQLAKTKIGNDAKLVAATPVSSIDYSSTSCVYALNDNKISLEVYYFYEESSVESKQDKLKSQELIVSKDGKTTTTKARQAVAGKKDQVLAVVSIVSAGKFDEGASNSLLQEILKRL